LVVTNTFTQGVVTIEKAAALDGPWFALQNRFSTGAQTEVRLRLTGAVSFCRAVAVDLSNGREGFTNLVQSYNLLTTIAGAGGQQDVNGWRPEYEGGPAADAVLSSPHITLADRAGNLYIADKDAHGIRQVRPDGTILTVAGTSVAGDGPDEPTPATEVALNGPNGLWVQPDGTLFILDLGNGKVRRRDLNGELSTLFAVPGGIIVGRGLWVSDDETLAYVSSLNTVKKWTPSEGVSDLAAGFAELGNLTVDAEGRVIVTDRGAHRVWRIEANGTRTVLAGNGTTSGGGDGQLATATGLDGVRGVWLVPTGGFFVGTHRGSQVWYVDPAGYIHLFLNGHRSDTHAGDGTWFYRPSELRVSEVRAVTMDFDGNVWVTEHDAGYIRKVEFLRHGP
jgi:DNA-binding beta-propeller fold protein YncE